ncbi:MAG TPA: type IV pilus assembly protein PilM [Candidatus Paceibacterota bacterium]|nr:type IV pilus assembly protein PilM [Verrucomicrobiota bacterium]HSA11651.1 type IV pilus assembly protein PilM [Candidatus Paceibacterota bacterium]
MLNTKSFLAVDFGAGSLKLAEFEVNEAGGLRLKQYGLKSLGAEGAQETTREAAMLKALQELIAEKAIKARDVNVCAPGFHVFSKFVKLPPVDANKVTQMIQYEAQQNVPFPLEEVVWDYQILGSTPGGELEVLLVAIKADVVEGLFRVTEATGLRLQLTDVSPAALCNAFRYNYGDLEDCTMLLDIGAKTSNLLFFEKGKVFSRSINLGANSITQDFIHESKLKYDAAEKLKIEEGFVSLGGAYEEPENPHQAAISKIARQFMTRLHIQVNQTMQFYRGQQGGGAPQRLFLSGGASVMPYTAQFFAEKLNVPVEYFNPLRNIQLDPALNLEELARVAHSLGEVVGLGLRNLAHCPVELNLMPESTLRWQSFNQKKPYFIATVFSLVAVIAAMGLLFQKLAGVKKEMLTAVEGDVEPAERKEVQFKKAYGDLKKTQADVDQIVGWMHNRYYWAEVLSELRQVLIRVEQTTYARLRTDAGVWIEQLMTAAPRLTGDVTASMGFGEAPVPSTGDIEAQQAFLKRYGMEMRGMAPEAPPQPAEAAPAEPAAAEGAVPTDPSAGVPPVDDTNQVATLTITFRAVSLKNVTGQADADKGIAYAVLQELQNSPLFVSDPKQTRTDSDVINDEQTGTFTFSVVARLKRPLKL